MENIYPPLESILMDIVGQQRLLLDIGGYGWLLLVIVGHQYMVISDGVRLIDFQCRSLAPIGIQWVSVGPLEYI